MRIGVVSLGEAGNMGDDLILLGVANAIAEVDRGHSLLFLSHGQELAWNELSNHIRIPERIERNRLGPFPSRHIRPSAEFAKCDGVILGGGGLLQDTHNPARPLQWLRNVPSNVPTMAIGLGVGPLSPLSKRLLRHWGAPVDEVWVRDDASRRLCEDQLGWDAGVSGDLVTPELLGALVPNEDVRNSAGAPLGVSLRAWPGLDAEQTAVHVREVAERTQTPSVNFFVLEARHGSGADALFSREVARRTGLDSECIVYKPQDLRRFLRSMSHCSAAISMKLHAGAVWEHFNIPIFPILYAPKTAAMYGRDYRGLEVLQDPTPHDRRWAESRVGNALIQQWLAKISQLDDGRSGAHDMGLSEQVVRKCSGAYSMGGDLVTVADIRLRRLLSRAERP